MSLKALQEHMMGFLLDTAANKDSAHHAKVAEMLTDEAPPEGLQIYSHAYRARLVEVLASDHEKLHRFLGEDRFDQLAADYVVKHPSQVRSLRHFGKQFPAFIAQSSFENAAQASALCAFERLLLDVYDAPFGNQLRHTTLERLPQDNWPTLALTAHPSLRLFVDRANAVRIWQLCNQGEEIALIDADRPPDTWLLWRDRERVCQFRHLEPAEESAINALLIERQSLTAAAEQLAAVIPPDDLAEALQGWLRQWFDDGLVSELAFS